ncbi:MAG: transglycosylase domain-containing protein [bacterium]
MFLRTSPKDFFTLSKFRLAKNSKLTRKPWLLPLLIISSLLAILLLVYFFRDLPSPTNLQKDVYPISTKILDRKGKLLYEIYDSQNRTPIALSTIPKYVSLASVAIEDKNFYRHHGFDTGGILRAAYKTLSGQRLEGGSTITQQLVKVALLSPERTLSRKLKEAVLTIATELLYSKAQIIEMYLNHIPYGGTVYGIEAASQTYFDKSAKDLTLAEAALLAGLPQAPTRYSPFFNPDSAKIRMSQVLSAMLDQKLITQEEADTAKKQEIHFSAPTSDIKAPHFVMYVRELLEQKYGLERLSIGGLRVTTTLDLDLQEVAEATLSAEMTSLKKLKISNGAALVTNPGSGEILVMIGSKNYFDDEIDGKVNITTRLRQPGSSIKPLNYALGIENNTITPSTMLLDTPICFEVTGQPDYCPKNYDNTFRGLTQIRFALGNSLNIAAVKVLALNGLPEFINFATRMGITTWENPDNYGLSLTLGGGEVKMTDMAVAFGVFANNGARVPLHAIIKIEDSKGQIIEEYNPNDNKEKVIELLNSDPTTDTSSPTSTPTKVLSYGTSFLISHILADNNARSAAFGTNSVLNIPGKTVSVKTGTTNNLRDNWTIGYTPDYLVATWVGNNDNTPMSYVASGITGASPIWQKIIKYILKDTKTTGLTPPKDIIEGASICSDSGIAPDASISCPTRYEYFLKGKVPSPALNPIERKDIFVNRSTRRPPENEGEAADVELESHIVAQDHFVKDYCLDCQPKSEGAPNSPPTYFPYSAFKITQ